jgi:hypothetical protein
MGGEEESDGRGRGERWEGKMRAMGGEEERAMGGEEERAMGGE